MKKKDPILAAVLGVLFPAFGYLYLGAWARLFAVLFVVLPVGRYVFGSYFVVVFWVGAVVDAYLAAKRHNQRLAAAEATKAEAGGRPTGGELP